MSCFDRPFSLMITCTPATGENGDEGHIVDLHISAEDPADIPCPACTYKLMLEASRLTRDRATGDFETIGRA